MCPLRAQEQQTDLLLMLGESGLVLEGLVAVKAGQLVVLHVAPQRIHVEERLRAELAREEVLGGRAAACAFLFYSINNQQSLHSLGSGAKLFPATASKLCVGAMPSCWDWRETVL